MEQDNHKLDTLTERLDELRSRGYDKEFKFENHSLCLIGSEPYKSYRPDELKIVEHYRFEGDSDPADMAVLYAVESKDGAKGTLIDAFGTYSDEQLSAFISKVEETGTDNSH